MWTLQVGTADALAFYLPGVVSQLGKVLHASRTMISGAAASAKALNQAIKALAEYLVVVLGDDASTSIHGAPMEDSSVFCSSKEKPLASFLEELRHLPAKKITQDDIKDSTESVEKSSILSRRDNITGSADLNVGSLHVERTVEWLANTAAQVNKLLSATFPHVSLTWLSLGIVWTILCFQFLVLFGLCFLCCSCSFVFILTKT